MDATNAAPNQSTTEDASAAPSYDEPYRFGRKPTARAPFPFTERQFARMLILRSRVDAAPSALDQAED